MIQVARQGVKTKYCWNESSLQLIFLSKNYQEKTSWFKIRSWDSRTKAAISVKNWTIYKLAFNAGSINDCNLPDKEKLHKLHNDISCDKKLIFQTSGSKQLNSSSKRFNKLSEQFLNVFIKAGKNKSRIIFFNLDFLSDKKFKMRFLKRVFI